MARSEKIMLLSQSPLSLVCKLGFCTVFTVHENALYHILRIVYLKYTIHARKLVCYMKYVYKNDFFSAKTFFHELSGFLST